MDEEDPGVEVFENCPVSPLQEGEASAWDSADGERSVLDLESCRSERFVGFFSAGRERLLKSSSVSAIIAILAPTLTLFVPDGC